MNKEEKIVYQNVCDSIDTYAKRMKNMAENAFEAHAVDCKDRNPMYIGLSNDVVAACMRWALFDLSMFVDSKENAIALSEKMRRNFRTPEQEASFFDKIIHTKF